MPKPTNPKIIIAQVEGSGTALMVIVPSATHCEHTPQKPRLPERYPPAPSTAEAQASEVPALKVFPVGAKILKKIS